MFDPEETHVHSVELALFGAGRIGQIQQSSTVVMPQTASWPSYDNTADTGSQCTLGRGM